MSEEQTPIEFVGFPKMARLTREMIVTEKIDGTNAQIFIGDDGKAMQVGSRTRWLKTGADNFGFHAWALEHYDELLKLVAAPGFMKAEGIVAYHVAGNVGFKKTLEKDEQPKSLADAKLNS